MQTAETERQAEASDDLFARVHHATVVHLLDQVRSGNDELLRVGARSDNSPISYFLGNCSKPAREVLFRACMQALNADCADQIAATLVQFVGIVAAEYADDYVPGLS